MGDRSGGGGGDNGHGTGLVVIGMGCAGLSAAVGYLEAPGDPAGRRVTVLERSSKDERGGSTRYTSSWFRVTGDRQLDPDFVADMEAFSGGLADLDYCRTLAREVPGSIGFLEEHGVEYVYFTQGLPNGNTGGGLGMPARSGRGIVEGLASVLEQHDGAELVYETEAVRLSVSDDGRVDGVVVRGPDGLLRTLRAPAVVIACGGFEGNQRMLTQYLGARACDMAVISPGTANNRGEGIAMALEIGADTAGQFDMAHIEPTDPRTAKPDAVIYPYTYGILVNGDAERFFDEGKDSFDETFEELGYEIWHNQGQTAFLVGDQTSLSVRGFGDCVFSDQPPVTAGTVRELAQKLGLDAGALERTVDRYNAAIAPGEFDPYSFDGKHTENLVPPKSNWAFPLDSPPFIAYPMTGSICFTFGGLRTDTSGRVLTPSGRPIPGLYAAGEVTGLYYHKYPVGTSVIRGVTFGRLAGMDAATAGAAAQPVSS